MSDFFDTAKNFMSSAVSRTSWEAQKQLRIRNKQSEIDKLLEQRAQLMNELGQVAMNLYQQGALSDSQLSRLCASIFELDHDLRTRETQIQEVKKEVYPADQLSSVPPANYAPPSSATSGSAQGYSGASNAGQVHCPQCGNMLRPGAIYCRSCGARLS